MDWRDPDDPETALSVVQRQDDPSKHWQRARHEALRRADLMWSRCGAEHRRRVWRYLYDDKSWWTIVPGQRPHRPDLYAVETIVVAVPTVIPWSGDVDDLIVLCMGCWIWRDVMAVRERKRQREARGQIALFAP